MIHERFDIERWNRLFPLEKLRKEAKEFVEALRREEPERYESKSDVEDHIKLMSPSGEIVTSPRHLAIVEHIVKTSYKSTSRVFFGALSFSPPVTAQTQNPAKPKERARRRLQKRTPIDWHRSAQ